MSKFEREDKVQAVLNAMMMVGKNSDSGVPW
jgi:hypothetical protein